MPQLTHQALLKELKDGALRPVYYLAGEEKLQREAAAAAVLKAAAPDPFNLAEYQGDALDIDELISAASTLPMFSERRVLVVKRAEALNAASRKALAAYLDAPLPSTTLVLLFDERPAKGDMLEASARSEGASVAYYAMKPEEASAWVIQKAKAGGKTLSFAAAETLVGEAGTDLSILQQELDKLLAFTKGEEGELGPAKVLESLGYRQAESIFDMSRAVERKDLKRALALVGPLCEAEDPFRVLYQVSGAIDKQLRAKRMAAAGIDEETIHRDLRVNRWYNKDFMRLARSRREAELIRALDRCVETESKLKSSPSASPLVELEQLLLDVCR